MILAHTLQTVDSAPGPFCLMRCAGKWVGLVQRLRSLNEDTAQMDRLFSKRIQCALLCLPSFPGRVAKLRLVQRLDFATANVFRVPSTNSKMDAFSTLECIWHSNPPQNAMTHEGPKVVEAKQLTACVSLAGCGRKDAWEQQTENMPVHPGVSRASRKKTIFSESSNDAPESDHSLDVCTMCQRGKCVRRCLVETRFHRAVMIHSQ